MAKYRRKLREVPQRDDYWMGQAFWVAAGSRNMGRQQGAIIVTSQNDFVTQAFDCSPRSMPDDGHFRHAETVAIFNAGRPLHGCTIYQTHTPCYECLMNIISSGIKRVVYFSTKQIEDISLDAAHSGYIQLEEYQGNLNWMRDYVKLLQDSGVF